MSSSGVEVDFFESKQAIGLNGQVIEGLADLPVAKIFGFALGVS